MNKGLILLVALWALVAIANARPLMLFADQTDAPLGLSNGFSGIALAFTTLKKGQGNHRVRFFGTNHISETLTGAWINYQNGTIIEQLAVSTNKNDRYFLGDVRLNTTIWEALLDEKIYATVASSSNKKGAITGYFRCRPHQGIAVLDASQVVGTTSSSAGVGLAWGEIAVTAITGGTLPQDILAQDTAITASSSFNGRVLHNATTATVVGFYGPANSTSTAGILATANLTGTFNDGHFSGVAVTDDFYSIDSGNTYYQVTASGGDIRGQVYPLLSPTRRAIPYSIDTVNGNTQIPAGGLRTLRFANQEGTERNSNSFVGLQATLAVTNYTYLSIFYFNAATNKKNFEIVRALTVEMNAKIAGSATWLFEFFDSSTGEFLPVGTLTTADDWTPAYIDHWSSLASEYANNRGQLAMRISVNSATPTTLYLDLFGVRSWTPSSLTNQALKSTVKIVSAFPGVFANGTEINSS